MTDGQPNWYLSEWAQQLGRRQADLAREPGWDKGKVSKYWHGTHPYRREIVNQVSAWLGIEPFELLMPPIKALALRRQGEIAAMIVAEAGNDFDHEAGAKPPARRKRTGTAG